MADPAPVVPPASPEQPAQPAQPAPSLLGSAPATPPTATKPPDAGTPPKPTEGTQDAPAAGEIKLTVPKDAPVTEADTKAIAEFAKANGLSQAQAEKVLERDIKSAADRIAQDKSRQDADKAAQFKALEQAKVDGAKAFSQDPDYGGPKQEQSLTNARRFVAKFADPELQKFLGTHPLGSDPLVLRMLARAGAAMGEDRPGGSHSGDAPVTQSIQDKFYPKAASTG